MGSPLISNSKDRDLSYFLRHSYYDIMEELRFASEEIEGICNKHGSRSKFYRYGIRFGAFSPTILRFFL